MKTLSITMQESLLRELDRRLPEAGLKGRSEAIRVAVQEWLQRRSLQKKIQREIEGYRRKPVKSDEFGPLLNSQRFPE